MAMRPWSRTTGVVRAIGRGSTGRRSWATGRAARAASYVAQMTWSSVRHSRRCFSAASGAGGATAPQRCSRATVELRHSPSTAARYGQTPLNGARRACFAGGRRCGARDGIDRGHARRIAGRGRPGRRGVNGDAGRPAGTQKSRRRPIFPKGCPLSIFGAGELNFRVRDGNGCGLSARVTGIFRVWMVSAAARRTVAMTGRGAGMDLRSRVVSGSDHDPPATDPWSVAEEVKPSTVSTAQLHPSPDFHMRPIKQVVSLRSYPVDPVGNLISRRASHLDAFSAYPNRT